MDSESSSARTQRVLIVDDDPDQLDGMATVFERSAREVVTCGTFEEARNRLLTEEFHCLVTDVRLGAFNGLQLAVIARDKNRGMAIVVFSGFDDPVLRDEAAQLGAKYLVKPINEEQLRDLVDAC